MSTSTPPAADSTLSRGTNSLPTLQDMHSRIGALEAKAGKPAPKSEKDGWDKFSTIASIVTPIVTGILGYYLVTSVDQGLKHQAQQVSNVSQMQELMTQLRDTKTKPADAQTSALAIAAFGPPAITPLLNLSQSGEANVLSAAEVGLRAIGMTDRDVTCTRLVDVIRSRSQLYSWYTHRTALRLIGDLQCPRAGPALQQYDQLLQRTNDPKQLQQFSLYVRPEQPPTFESIDLLKNDSKRAIASVAAALGTP